MSTDTLQRAFELADSGACRSISELRVALAREQRDAIDAHLSGAGLKKQLLARIEKARKPNGGRAVERDA